MQILPKMYALQPPKKTSQKQTISFSSEKAGFELYKTLLDSYQKDFGAIPSAAKLATEILHDPTKRQSLYSPMMSANYKVEKLMGMLLRNFSYDEYLNNLIFNVKDINAISCGFACEILQYNLYSKGIKSHIINMSLEKKGSQEQQSSRYSNDHSFLLLDYAEPFDIKNPSSWGETSIIIDPLFNKIGPSCEVLKDYQSLFKIDSKTEKPTFTNENIFNVPKMLERKHFHYW